MLKMIKNNALMESKELYEEEKYGDAGETMEQETNYHYNKQNAESTEKINFNTNEDDDDYQMK